MSEHQEPAEESVVPVLHNCTNESFWEDSDGDWHWRFTDADGVRHSNDGVYGRLCFNTRAEAEENLRKYMEYRALFGRPK